MYEQYFREFVQYLFPNDLLDVSILDSIEFDRTIEDINEYINEYQKKHGFNIMADKIRTEVVVYLSRMLIEMKKDKTQHPKKDLIDYNLEELIDILKLANAPNLNKCISFREFLRNKQVMIELEVAT